MLPHIPQSEQHPGNLAGISLHAISSAEEDLLLAWGSRWSFKTASTTVNSTFISAAKMLWKKRRNVLAEDCWSGIFAGNFPLVCVCACARHGDACGLRWSAWSELKQVRLTQVLVCFWGGKQQVCASRGRWRGCLLFVCEVNWRSIMKTWIAAGNVPCYLTTHHSACMQAYSFTPSLFWRTSVFVFRKSFMHFKVKLH